MGLLEALKSNGSDPGKNGSNDPGPKQSQLTWDQMKLWNKYRKSNRGSIEDVYRQMAKENPEVAKSLPLEKLTAAFEEQSKRDYENRVADYDQKKATGYYSDDNPEWARLKSMGWEDWGGPEYKTIDSFLPVSYDDGNGKVYDLGVSDEYGNIENPNKVPLPSKGGPMKHQIGKFSDDTRMDDIYMSDKYNGYVEFPDPQSGDIKYATEQEAERMFGNTWRTRRDQLRNQIIEAAKAKRAAAEKRRQEVEARKAAAGKG